MLPASNRGAGMNIGFPDVCLTPVGPAVVPIPYPNFAANAMAASFSPNVLLTMMPALNMGSIIPMTFGDEPGVAHPTIKGAATYTMGNPVTHINGLPAITLTCPTTGNNMNDGMAMVAVPSITNVFLTYAGGEAADDLSQEGGAVEAALQDGGVGHIRIHTFSRDVPARVYTAMQDLTAQGMLALILDLRGNPGGELMAALELAGDFLEPGAALVTMRDEDGDERLYRASGGDPYRIPLVLFVDGGTASAAEIFAGCLQAHGRALVAGEATYGKGIGAIPAPAIDSEGIVRERRASFFLPNGRALHGAGITPDVPLPFSSR